MALRRIGVGAVVKVSATFGFLMVVLVAVLAAVAYVVGSAYGLVHGVDRLAVRVFNARSFHLTVGVFVAGAAALAAAVAVVAVVLAALAAVIYNRSADLTGGLGGRLVRAPGNSRPAAQSAGPSPAGAARPAARAGAGRGTQPDSRLA